MDKKRVTKRNNIISLKMDANFYVDRAFHSLDRFRYDKARRYVKRAIELDPDNPINYCNLAGILSEMGRYEESNEILHDVIENIDPTLTECYFYLANNYANLDDFERAEDYVIRYLEQEQDGEFYYDAQEMLEFISVELQGTRRRIKPEVKDSVLESHDAACRLLESGKFVEAVTRLELLIQEFPEFHAGKNNLALAYFYMGQADKAKATVEALLAKEPHNIHGLCNLAIFYQHEQNNQGLETLLRKLRTIVPLNMEHAHKLATTMGILGEHETAFQLFMKLAKDEDHLDHTLYHSIAVASTYLGKYDFAEKMWRMAARLDRVSGIPERYIEMLTVWRVDLGASRLVPYIPYHYRLPHDTFSKASDVTRS